MGSPMGNSPTVLGSNPVTNNPITNSVGQGGNDFRDFMNTQTDKTTKMINGVPGLPGAAPDLANIQQATNVGDVGRAQQGAINSLGSQQALLQALQSQNGLGMQNAAGNNQLGLANQLQAANGVGAQQGAISGLQNTAGMYQNIAQGKGPNPAQAMLNQATGQNVANQAALMAGQRGAGANVGLMARQAGQQGANLQQQAVGQGATMQANQQLNALAGLGGTQQAIGGLGSGLTNQQMGANQAYTNQANQVAGQQIAGTSANTQANLANQQQMQNSLQGINNSNVASQASVNAGNVPLAQSNAAAKQGIFGGLMNGLGSLIGGGGAGAAGGMVHMADGGDPNMSSMNQPNGVGQIMNPAPAPNMSQAPSQPVSSFGQYINNQSDVNPFAAKNEDEEKDTQKQAKKLTQDKYDYKSTGPNAMSKGAANLIKGIGMAVMAASKGGMANSGGKVDAKSSSQKAEKSGNSYSNDKIPAMLSEGEIVLPRSVTQSKDPQGAAAKFVAQVLARRKVS